MADEQTEHVLLNGTLLSSLAHDAATCEVGDSDGLFWGQWQQRTKQELRDSQSQSSTSIDAVHPPSFEAVLAVRLVIGITCFCLLAVIVRRSRCCRKSSKSRGRKVGRKTSTGVSMQSWSDKSRLVDSMGDYEEYDFLYSG